MKSILARLCLASALLAPLIGYAADCETPPRLRFALSPVKNPERQHTQYQPLIRQLEKALDRPVDLVVTPSYGAVIEGLLNESIDLAEIGPASYAIAMSRGAHITPFASFAKKEANGEISSTYRSLLIVRSDRKIIHLAELKNSTLSLTDPASTSGAVLPRQAIAKLTGQPMATYFKQIIFAGSHDRAIDNVRQKRVDAAFISSNRLDEALRLGNIQPKELRILWQSTPIPFDPFVLRDRLCPAISQKIRAVFFGDTTPLASLFDELKYIGFVPASDTAYRAIRELFAPP